MAIFFKLLLIFLLLNCDKEKPIEKVLDNTKKIIFFGDSLTAGRGVLAEESFPGIIAEKLRLENKGYEVVNAGVSGDTTSTGLARLEWVLADVNVKIFVLELGANDGMRGIPVKNIKKNLRKIISIVKKKYPECKIILAEMKAFPNMGIKFTSEFNHSFAEVAKTENVVLMPFLLKGVAGEKKLNQEDGIHPTAAGYKIVADNVYIFLTKFL